MGIKLIAEIGQAHEGSLGIAHSYIDALATTGVDIVKFQTHIASAESSVNESFRVNFSYEDSTRFDYWKRMEFTAEQWAGLKSHCEDRGLEFVSSPFSMEAVDLLNDLDVKCFKIGSGEVRNLLMLHHIAKTGKDIWISSGMSSESELSNSLDSLNGYGCKIALFQCTSEYPTYPESWGLNVITEWQKRYQLPIGFSDHSGDIFACIAAATVGAKFLEFHTVFDKKMFGPDSKSSLNISQIKQLVTGVRQIELALEKPVDKNQVEKYSSNKVLFGKSLAARNQMSAGVIITEDKLESKKPGNCGVSATDYKLILGKKLVREKNIGDFIQWEDFSDV
jgi:N,N'-diacetyllegionaminate synthase